MNKIMTEESDSKDTKTKNCVKGSQDIKVKTKQEAHSDVTVYILHHLFKILKHPVYSSEMYSIKMSVDQIVLQNSTPYLHPFHP